MKISLTVKCCHTSPKILNLSTNKRTCSNCPNLNRPHKKKILKKRFKEHTLPDTFKRLSQYSNEPEFIVALIIWLLYAYVKRNLISTH